MIGRLAHEWKGCSSIPTSQKNVLSGAAGKRTDSFSSRADRAALQSWRAWGEAWMLLLLLRQDPVVGVHQGVVGKSQKVFERVKKSLYMDIYIYKVPKNSKPFNQKLYLCYKQQAYCEPLTQTLRSNHEGAMGVSETLVKKGCWLLSSQGCQWLLQACPRST